MDYHKSYFKYSPINNLEEALDWLITKKKNVKTKLLYNHKSLIFSFLTKACENAYKCYIF